VELLVIQPTPFCNIDCRYCYLPHRNSKAVVAQQTLANLFSQVFASGWVRDCLSVVWHAGEPTVLPIGFYCDAFRMIDRLKPADLTVAHSFQTNGTLIDEAWCAFFGEERVNVGVSVDGPKHLHDRNRLTRSGRGTRQDDRRHPIAAPERYSVSRDLGPVNGQHGSGPRDVRFLCRGGDRGGVLQCRGIGR
jgi:uncharacterized protein